MLPGERVTVLDRWTFCLYAVVDAQRPTEEALAELVDLDERPER